MKTFILLSVLVILAAVYYFLIIRREKPNDPFPPIPRDPPANSEPPKMPNEGNQ